MQPLHGLKVIEIAALGPAPCAGMMLADMGAQVTLIERIADTGDRSAARAKANKDFYRRGKRSLALDLKAAGSADLVLALLEGSDILIEGFRPGVMERLGLGPEPCLAANPALVYGRMTGWGQTGPLAHCAGHDPNYIALSGALWYGGRADSAPRAPLTALGDVGGGTMMLLWGIMCALNRAASTGVGCVVDAAITDGSAYLSSLLWSTRAHGEIDDQLGSGWASGGAPWNQTYRCADNNYITVCALEPQFYALLLQKLQLTTHAMFADQWNKDHWGEATKILTTLFLGHPRAYWCELLEGSDACFAPVLNFPEATEHPHNIERSVFTTIDGVSQPRPAPKLSGYTPELRPPPIPGEHSAAILSELGLGGLGDGGIKK